jgi:hypothetical protein
MAEAEALAGRAGAGPRSQLGRMITEVRRLADDEASDGDQG